jgi:hypothetical protein
MGYPAVTSWGTSHILGMNDCCQNATFYPRSCHECDNRTRILTVGVAGRYVKKKYGQASIVRRIYAALFITSGFP